MTDKLSPIHPGEVLLEEFLKPMELSQNRLAIDIGVDARRINEIVQGKRSVTADTALRLARFFGNESEFDWLFIHHDQATLIRQNICDILTADFDLFSLVRQNKL